VINAGFGDKSGETHLKIRIFALAKELKLDSKELIEICNEAGVKLKNSALASISPAERDIVVGYLQSRGESGSSSHDRSAAVPVREIPRTEGGKVRAITAPAPRRSPERVSEVAVDETATVSAEDTSSVAVSDESTEVAATTIVAESAEGPSAVAAEGDRAEVTVPDEAAAADQPGEPVADAPVAAISRDEYVPPAGAAGRSIREMRPRGTVPGGGGDRSSRPKAGRSKPAMPNIAAPPAYKPLKPKAAKPVESKAQKPDLPLTPDPAAAESALQSYSQTRRTKTAKEERQGRNPGRPASSRQRRAGPRTGTAGSRPVIEAAATTRRWSLPYAPSAATEADRSGRPEDIRSDRNADHHSRSVRSDRPARERPDSDSVPAGTDGDDQREHRRRNRSGTGNGNGRRSRNSPAAGH